MKKQNIRIEVFLLLIVIFISCKNDVEPPNNNEMKATIVLAPGDTVKIDATGAKAVMGCPPLGGTYVEGTNEANSAVYLLHIGGLNCVASPGTYEFSCEYRENVVAPNTPIYSNHLGGNPGSITFTKINDDYMEGFFNATCRCYSPGCTYDTDSVIVSGSFKGNHFN